MTQAETPDNSNPKHSPGKLLCRARQARALSLSDVAGQLKLPRSTIEHIESDRFDQIAPIYRRGYIFNYARLVELDPEPLLAQMGTLEPEPLRSVLPASGNSQRFDKFLKFATYALVTTMIVPPLVYFFVLGGARLFESEIVSRSIDGGSESYSEVSKPGYRERVADALAVQSPEATQNDASHLSASALPMNAIRVPALVESVADSVDQDLVDNSTDEKSPSEADPLVSLELILSDDSWVEIESADGQRLEFDLLRSGEIRQYSGLAPLRLLLGRASAVSLSLDGRPLAFDGEDKAGVAELVIGEPAPVPTAGDPGGGAPTE